MTLLWLFVIVGVSALLIWQFVGYPPLLMATVALRAKPRVVDYTYQPFVSILVPTYNEETVIAQRIENLLNLNYPGENYEIIVLIPVLLTEPSASCKISCKVMGGITIRQ